jgi:hypothetical protein
MEGFSFVTPITGLNRPNAGKEDDENNNSNAFTIGKDNMSDSCALVNTHLAVRIRISQ